ncbi:MAG: helix-turn-helix domain-containing protein [Meiothermus sp.]|nr:helix-turn-helix domain-containing protein [Meiothermus sp.]
MSAYPVELRWRVLSAYEAGEGSYRELAERFMVDWGTVQDWMDLYRETGDLEARRCGRKADPAVEAVWRERLTTLVKEQNDLTLAELVERLEERYGQKSSISSVDRWLTKLKLTRKKRRSGPVSKTVSESGS